MPSSDRLSTFSRLFLEGDNDTTVKIITELRKGKDEKPLLQSYMNEVIAPFMDDVEVDDHEFEKLVTDFCAEGRSDIFLTAVLSADSRKRYFGPSSDHRRELFIFQDSSSAEPREICMTQALSLPNCFSKIATAKLIGVRNNPATRCVVLVHTKQTAEESAAAIWNTLLAMHRFGFSDGLRDAYRSLEDSQIVLIASLVVDAFSSEDPESSKDDQNQSIQQQSNEDTLAIPSTLPNLSMVNKNRADLRSIRDRLIEEKRREAFAKHQQQQQQQQEMMNQNFKRNLTPMSVAAPPASQVNKQQAEELLRMAPMSNSAVMAAQRPLPANGNSTCQVVMQPSDASEEAPPLTASFEAMLTACGVTPTWTLLRQHREHLMSSSANSDPTVTAGEHKVKDDNSNSNTGNNSNNTASNISSDKKLLPLLKTTPLLPLVELFCLQDEHGEPLGGLDDQGPLAFPHPPSPLPDFPPVSSLRLHQHGLASGVHSQDISRIQHHPHMSNPSQYVHGAWPQRIHTNNLQMQQMAVAWAFQQQQQQHALAAARGGHGSFPPNAAGSYPHAAAGGAVIPYGFDASQQNPQFRGGLPSPFPKDASSMTLEQQQQFYHQQFMLQQFLQQQHQQQQAAGPPGGVQAVGHRPTE